MTQVCAVGSPVAASPINGSFEESGRFYENVRLVGSDQDKLVALCDALLFYCAVARLRTRPVTITEAEGCARITWSGYAPAVFRNSPLLGLVAKGEYIDHVTVQESISALGRINL